MAQLSFHNNSFKQAPPKNGKSMIFLYYTNLLKVINYGTVSLLGYQKLNDIYWAQK